MVEVYNKKNKKIFSFKTDSIVLVKKKLRQMNMIRAAKYLIEISYGKLSTYFCTSCHSRSYLDYPIVNNPDDIVCNNCKQDNKLFFVGFKQSENQMKVQHAV